MDKKEIKQQLSNAYDLIQRDELEEALEIINPILREQPDNADAWWLKANAATEPSEVRESLVNVLLIKPKDPRAEEMLEMLNDAYPPNSPEDFKVMEKLFAKRSQEDFVFDAGDPFADIDNALGGKSAGNADFDVFADEDPFAALLGDTPAEGDTAAPAKKRRREKEKAEKSGGGLLRPLLILTVLILVVGAVFFVMSQGSSNDSSDTGDSSPTGTGDVLALLPEDTAAQPEVGQWVTELDTQLSQTDFNFEPSVVAKNDAGGNTLFVNACVCLTTSCQGNTADKMVGLAQTAMTSANSIVVGQPTSTETLDAFGINIRACEGTDTLYRAYINIDENATVNASDVSQWVESN